jgi:hypothetical protein
MPAIASIDAKISVGGEQHWVAQDFGHADQTCVGQAHGHVCVFAQERDHMVGVVIQTERANDGRTLDKFDELSDAPFPQQVKCFG